MNQNQEQLKVNVEIKQTTPITSEDGNQVFQEAVVLRKVSKFLAGTKEDAVIPVPVFVDIKTGKILIELMPTDLREEYEEYNKTK
jgi:hypothetical protein